MRIPFRTLVPVVAVVILSTASLGQAQANLAGTWVLDRSQSQLAHPQPGGDAPSQGSPQAPPPEVRLIVEQNGGVVKVTRTVTLGNTERSISQTYTVDGSEQTFTGPRNRIVVTRATWDGVRLVVSSKSTMPDPAGGETQFARQSVWSLSPDGRTLTIQTTFQGPRGERSVTRVYQRA